MLVKSIFFFVYNIIIKVIYSYSGVYRNNDKKGIYINKSPNTKEKYIEGFLIYTYLWISEISLCKDPRGIIHGGVLTSFL